jgi:hypothetical protein
LTPRPGAACRLAAVLFLCLGRPGPAAAEPPAAAPRLVAKEEILAAMQRSRGYELRATANGPRVQAEVLLRLIADAERSDPARRPLLFRHAEWYAAFLERAQLTPAQAPLYARLAHDIGQDLVADWRRERVIDQVLGGPAPVRAANVCIWWEDAPGKPDVLAYDDDLSDPKLRVSQSRLITYRLVDYGDRVWYAEVEGLRGRPTSGALGAIFAIIGETTVVESWSATAPDGTMVARGRGRKWWFDRTETVTVLPSGRGDRGVPPGRPDLAALEARLKEPLAIRFRPLDPR